VDPTHVGAGLSFVIADDHPMVRDALASALRSAFDAPAIKR
jgi:DNA-binding NarL/FixJ family response regulator